MKKNSNLLARGKKVALMVVLATCLAGCGQENYADANENSALWKKVVGVALLGVGMYGLGFVKGRTSRGDE